VIAVAEQHATTQIVIALEQLIGPAELHQQLGVERIALLGAVDAHEQNVAAPLQRQDVLILSCAHGQPFRAGIRLR
jgi:hypothetical protein